MKAKDTDFTYIFESLSDKSFRLCMGYLKNEHDAEDAVQEAFINVYKALPKFRGESSIITWLYKICANQCLIALRKRKKEIKTVGFDNFKALEESLELISYETPDEILERKEEKIEFYNALNSIPNNNYITAIIAKLLTDNDKESAKIIGISGPAYRSRLHRAKSNLKQIIQNERDY